MTVKQRQSNDSPHIWHRIEEHEKELALIRRDLAGVQTTVSHTSDTVEVMSSKLDKMAQSFAGYGKASVSEIAAYLQIIALGFSIIAGIVTGIVYIANNANNSRLELLDYKMSRIYGSFGWEPTVRRAIPGENSDGKR